MVSTGDTEISLHIRSPRFLASRGGGGRYYGVTTENTQSAKICLNFNFRRGGYFDLKFREGCSGEFGQKFTVHTETCLCITDSLSHTTYVETNKGLGTRQLLVYLFYIAIEKRKRSSCPWHSRGVWQDDNQGTEQGLHERDRYVKYVNNTRITKASLSSWFQQTHQPLRSILLPNTNFNQTNNQNSDTITTKFCQRPVKAWGQKIRMRREILACDVVPVSQTGPEFPQILSHGFIQHPDASTARPTNPSEY